jgi:ERF superfamily
MPDLARLDSRDLAAAPQSMLETVMRAVADPSIDPARLREFLEIGERLEARAAKQQFDRAMAAMRPLLPTIKKNGLIVRNATAKYPHGSQTAFAKWDDIHKACMPILDEHGFTCSFNSELQGSNALKVTMTVHHISGHAETGSLVVPWLDDGGSKSPAQAAASSFTLAQRHCFIKFFNILTEGSEDSPERITDGQAQNIADLIQEAENRRPGSSRRFATWLKTAYKAENYLELFQGDQHKAAVALLQQMLGAEKK